MCLECVTRYPGNWWPPIVTLAFHAAAPQDGIAVQVSMCPSCIPEQCIELSSVRWVPRISPGPWKLIKVFSRCSEPHIGFGSWCNPGTDWSQKPEPWSAWQAWPPGSPPEASVGRSWKGLRGEGAGHEGSAISTHGRGAHPSAGHRRAFFPFQPVVPPPPALPSLRVSTLGKKATQTPAAVAAVPSSLSRYPHDVPGHSLSLPRLFASDSRPLGSPVTRLSPAHLSNQQRVADETSGPCSERTKETGSPQHERPPAELRGRPIAQSASCDREN